MLNQTLVVGLVSVIDILLGVFVYLRNTKLRANKAFLFMSISVVVWMVSSYLTDNGWNFQAKLFFGRTSFAAALIIIISILNLAKAFPVSQKYKRIDIALLGLIALTIVLCYTPLIVKTIEVLPTGISSVVPGLLYSLWLVTFVSGAVIAAFSFFQQYKKADNVGKSQLKLIIIGLGAGLSFGLITNVIVPLILPNSGATSFGPFATVILVSACAYAIVRHRLFDIRFVVARSAAYVLTIAALLAGYLLVVFGVGQIVTIGPELNAAQRFFYIGIALVFALTLPGLKKIFDRVTNTVFYRDAYDTQVVLDNVSSVIVGNVDPHRIQKGSLGGLMDALKTTYITFILTDATGLHMGDTIGQHWTMHDQQQLHTALKHAGKKILIYDELEPRFTKLKEVLRIEDISLVSPLVTKDEIIGYLVFGPKKSGNIFNSQDIGLLTIASNELAVALQNAQRFEEIQAFNVTLQEKVTDATRELKSTNKKLVALDEAKDEFISMASHQLRTPLTSIKGYLSMLLEGDLGKVSGAQEKALKEAFGSSQRMVYLIADFLNVSRIKTGKFMIEPKEVDLPQIVTEEITQLREMAGARELTLEYEQPEVFPRVMLDDNKIRQVMMNMVDNAIYYTPSGGKITIQLYSTGDEIIFKVVDNGIGVPKNEQHKLFTKFYRAGNARKSRPDGTGLGLFMAQKIIVEQGGAIIFESTEGKGSTFGWRFPLAKIKV